MTKYRGIIPPALTLAALFSGCQHLPPEPLNLSAINEELHNRPLDIEAVKDYAARLRLPASEAATSFDTSDGITLQEAQAIALWYNPDLRVARMEAEQAADIAANSGAWDDPQLGFSGGEKETAEESGGLLREAGGLSRSWISATSLSITIPISGRPRAARKVDALAYETLASAAREAEWQMLAKMREAWLQWSSLQEEARLLESHLPLLQDVCNTAKALSDAGEIFPTAARLFAIDLAATHSMLIEIQSREFDARLALLGLMGLTPTAPLELLPTMQLAARGPMFDESIALDLETHPLLDQAQAAYALAEAQLALELRKQYPDLTVSPEYVKEQDETSLALGLGIPLPTWNANRRGIAEALGARKVARARLEAEVLELLGAVERARRVLDAAARQQEDLEGKLAPMLDEQLSELETLLSVGELDLLVFFEALQQTLQAKQKIIHAQLAQQLAASQIMTLHAAGETLASPAQESNND